jgi:glucokinase
MAIANICVTIGPRKVVIGGGVSQAGEVLLGPARRMVHERVHMAPVDQVQIILAELGINAGLVGAAAWASLNG